MEHSDDHLARGVSADPSSSECGAEDYVETPTADEPSMKYARERRGPPLSPEHNVCPIAVDCDRQFYLAFRGDCEQGDTEEQCEVSFQMTCES